MQIDKRTIIGGKYAIDYQIDTGAMGRVYGATQLGLDRRVALKIMNDSGAEYRRRFLVEAHSMARMNHRNVVTIFDAGETEQGLVFIVMELLRGRTLADALEQKRRFEVLRALHLITQISRGLRAAHREGVVHRDLKPSNIFLVDDRDEHEIVKVFDFGIAKPPATTPHHLDTSAGIIVGTPAYMAPEQIEGKPVDARTDLYALGVMLYLLLTGRTPFVNPNAVEVMLAHLKNPPPSSRVFCPTIPEAVDAIVMRLLAKNPAERFANVDALLHAIAEQMVLLGGEMFRPQLTDAFARPSTASSSAPSGASSGASSTASSGASTVRASTPPRAPFTGEHVNPFASEPSHAPQRVRGEPLPRFDSPSPRTPAFILTPPKCATNVLVADEESPHARESERDGARAHKTSARAHKTSARDRGHVRERRLQAFALGAILLSASTAAVSTENVLWTAFVAMQGAEQAVAQDATAATEPVRARDARVATAPSATPPPPVQWEPTASSCVRGMCLDASAASSTRAPAKPKRSVARSKAATRLTPREPPNAGPLM